METAEAAAAAEEEEEEKAEEEEEEEEEEALATIGDGAAVPGKPAVVERLMRCFVVERDLCAREGERWREGGGRVQFARGQRREGAEQTGCTPFARTCANVYAKREGGWER